MKKVILVLLSVILTSGLLFADKKCCKDKSSCKKTACVKKAGDVAAAEPMHGCCKNAAAAGKGCCKKDAATLQKQAQMESRVEAAKAPAERSVDAPVRVIQSTK